MTAVAGDHPLELLPNVGVFRAVANAAAALFDVGVGPGVGLVLRPVLEVLESGRAAVPEQLAKGLGLAAAAKVLVEPLATAGRRRDNPALDVVHPLHLIGQAVLPWRRADLARPVERVAGALDAHND